MGAAFIEILKFFYDKGVLMMAPGWVSLGLVAYIEFWQIGPAQADAISLKEDVTALLRSQKEVRLEAAFTALCMNPGDAEVLARIRNLQDEYRKLTRSDKEPQGHPYPPPDCSLLMKIK